MSNFDSSRKFEAVKPYPFSWDFKDPLEEAVGGNFGFQPLQTRFTDTVHALHRKLRSQKEEIANRALDLHGAGETSMKLSFPDPIAPYKKAFAELLPGKSLVDLDERNQSLRYRHDQTPQALPFKTLSSGELEVVRIVFDFLLRSPEDCVVVFDEPELHLHPELSHRLLSTLREAGARNQFIFCTHSAEIISASLDNTVVFLQPAQVEDKVSGSTEAEVVEYNQAMMIDEESNAAKVLHLLGQSIGVISLGQHIVLIEGENSSLDKKTYGSIVGPTYPGLVLAPAGGRDAMERFSTAVASVLDKTVWGVDFFVLCDGDSSVAEDQLAKLESSSGGKLKKLPRYHLKNYFLDGPLLSKVFQEQGDPMESWLVDPEMVEIRLREIARPLVSYAAAMRVAHKLRMQVGNVNVLPKGCSNKSLDDLLTLVKERAELENTRVAGTLDPSEVQSLVEAEFKMIGQALDDGNELWKALIPGRPILNTFASISRMDAARLKRMAIRLAPELDQDPFEDIRQIFSHFAGLIDKV